MIAVGKRRRQIIALASIALLQAGSASAQGVASGYSGSPGISVRAGNDAGAVRELYDLGTCLVRSARPQAIAVLATPSNSQEQVAATDKLFNAGKYCVYVRQIRMEGTLFRGALAEALLASTKQQAPLGPVAPSIEPFAEFASGVQASRVTDRTKAILLASWFASCIASSRPDLVRSLLDQRPGSSREREALKAATMASTCRAPVPQPPIDSMTARALLADAYYQRFSGQLSNAGGKTSENERVRFELTREQLHA